ncbi:alpha/beta hydrolase family esterase [Corynebacterium riegelii]|uniref:alpha/beta hydrolase family esterase n=1 Tax=Corynebacterium riegelii TaxID=156976 RepID=UPI0023F95B5D|nr:hypothetical protein [Corynebacterium riegelii]
MRHSMDYGGLERTWIQIDGDPGTAIMFLHGSRQSASVVRNFTNHQFEGLGPTVVYPDGYHHHFNDLRVEFQERARRDNIDDVGFLTALAGRFDRVIACGFSNGGQMVLRLLWESPITFEAAALFGASLPIDANVIELSAPFTPTPLLIVQGTEDPLVPYQGGMSGIGNANRGETMSAMDSARRLARYNGAETQHTHTQHDGYTEDTWNAPGAQPVRLVSVAGVGHLVPVDKQLDPRLGPGTDKVTGAQLLTRFLDAAGQTH